MSRTPQRFPGAALEEDSIQFEDRGSDPPEIGSIWRRVGDLFARDTIGKFNLRQAGSVGVIEVPFLNALVVLVEHTRSYRPLVQVILDELSGFNLSGWSSVAWNENTTTENIRLPDEQYTTIHDDGLFWIEFGSALSGKVLYF